LSLLYRENTMIREEIPMKVTLIVAALLLTLTRAWAGQPGPTPPNVAQLDLAEQLTCDAPDHSWIPPYDFPGTLIFSTRGNPVMLVVSLNMAHTPNFQNYGPGVEIVLVVDGQVVGVPVRNAYSFGGGYEALAVSTTQLIAMGAGAHTFSLRMSCRNHWTLLDGRIQSYELPSIAK
jgi:hypothetical protein